MACDGIGNSADLRQRSIERKPREWKEGGLEAYPFTDGIRISSRPCVLAGIQSPKGRGKWGRRLRGLSDLIPKQLPKSTTGAQSVLV